jgi:hypothetical protein
MGKATFELFDEDREVKEAVAIGLQESLDLIGAIWLLTAGAQAPVRGLGDALNRSRLGCVRVTAPQRVLRGRLGRRLEFRIWLIISQVVDEEPNAIAATYEQQQKSYESHTGDHSTKPRSLGRVDHQFPDQPLQQIFRSVPNARVWS